jgi:fatty acid desaturase
MTARLAAFQRDIDDVINACRAAAGKRDIRHARFFLFLCRLTEVAGLALGAWSLNPFAPILIGLAQVGRWGLAHQILHCSYDRVAGCPDWLRGSRFARGWRRYWDWCDWIVPDAWQHEHNVHHVNTGGPRDPDIVEANVAFLRRATFPRWQKALVALLIMCTWRLSYYAPSTLIQLRRKEQGLKPTIYEITGVLMFAPLLNPMAKPGRDFWRRCLLPNVCLRFVLIPLCALPFGLDAVRNLFLTQLGAEVLTNLYTWALIASSHTADDLHRFDHVPQGRGEWYLHQLLGTADYAHGSSLIAWLQAWVNYQIEHHLCPNLPLLQLERMQSEIERVCLVHGIPYVRQPLPRRFAKMFSIMIGDTRMRQQLACPRADSTGIGFLSRGS